MVHPEDFIGLFAGIKYIIVHVNPSDNSYLDGTVVGIMVRPSSSISTWPPQAVADYDQASLQ
jgi:hypothetical protein